MRLKGRCPLINRLSYNIQAAKTHVSQGPYDLFLPTAPFRWHSCPHVALTDSTVSHGWTHKKALSSGSVPNGPETGTATACGSPGRGDSRKFTFLIDLNADRQLDSWGLPSPLFTLYRRVVWKYWVYLLWLLSLAFLILYFPFEWNVNPILNLRLLLLCRNLGLGNPCKIFILRSWVLTWTHVSLLKFKVFLCLKETN